MEPEQTATSLRSPDKDATLSFVDSKTIVKIPTKTVINLQSQNKDIEDQISIDNDQDENQNQDESTKQDHKQMEGLDDEQEMKNDAAKLK